MKRNRNTPRTPTEPSGATISPPQPPTLQQQLDEALAANAGLVNLLDAVSANLDRLRLAIAGSIKR